MRILLAGIGNIFCGDDAFGTEVARELMRRAWPEDVRIQDFGVRSYDLAYAIMDGYDAVVLIDATPQGLEPGTVSLIELDEKLPGVQPDEIANAHGMNPIRVLQMVQTLGGEIRSLYLIGCEPAVLETEELGLSPAVQAAVPVACAMAETLVAELRAGLIVASGIR
jgi:hydrogenase maturation protease